MALHLRAGAIQAFEFIYELSIKTLRRYLIETEANPGAVEDMSFNDLIIPAFLAEARFLAARIAERQEPSA